MSALSQHLGLTEDELESLDLDIHADTGSSGDMVYEYYFSVPENTPIELLRKMQVKTGQTVRLPIHIVDADEEDNYIVDMAEMRWVKQNPQTERFDDISFDLEMMKEKLNDHTQYMTENEVKMYYGYSVTLFEAFLCETAKHLILNNNESLKKAAEYFSKSETAQKFTIAQAMNLDTPKYIIGLVSNLTFHNPKTSQKFLSEVLLTIIDLTPLEAVIRNRHDIIHRNGKRIDGTTIELERNEVINAIELINKSIIDIHSITLKLLNV